MTPAFRIIDANANRAREALRVLEDIARFVLNDPALCAGLKATRHLLCAHLNTPPLDHAQQLAWRDTPGDIGTEISTETERSRENIHAVAAAAGGRLGEALRSIEEAVKTLPGAGDLSAKIEGARYEMYEYERRLLVALGGARAPRWRVCVLVTRSLCAGRTREEVVEAAIAGGANCIQLREKDLSGAALLGAARSLRGITERAGVSLVINDRPDVALLARADGVHVGQEDLPIREVRRLVGRSLLVGVSTSNVDQARAAAREGADYCGIGPMFETTTVPKPGIVGPEAVRAYLADPVASRVPHLAIGGITPENVARVVGAGAHGVAVSSAVCGASDPELVCRALRDVFETAGKRVS